MICLRDGQLVEQRPWSDQELEKARRWRREGLGASGIGKLLGRSKNSVIGALWRGQEPRVRVNQHRTLYAPQPRSIPMRFSEQTHV